MWTQLYMPRALYMNQNVGLSAKELPVQIWAAVYPWLWQYCFNYAHVFELKCRSSWLNCFIWCVKKNADQTPQQIHHWKDRWALSSSSSSSEKFDGHLYCCLSANSSANGPPALKKLRWRSNAGLGWHLLVGGTTPQHTNKPQPKRLRFLLSSIFLACSVSNGNTGPEASD